jgi:DNA-binding IclR family transcriptional regulator
MYDELAQIRERNMAMDREENELGVSCLAVPVFDIHGRALCHFYLLINIAPQAGRREEFTRRCAIRQRRFLANWAFPCGKGKADDQIVPGI